MAEYPKQVNIKGKDVNGNEILLDGLKSVTEVKVSEEIDSDVVKTFDEPVAVPSSEGGYTISTELLEARDIEEFIKLRRVLKGMKKYPGEFSVFETHQTRDGTEVKEESHFTGCLISSNEITYSAEDLTARSIEFKAKKLTEKLNGEEI